MELRGARPGELADWLWDFDARPMTDEDRAAIADYVMSLTPIDNHVASKSEKK